MSGADLILYGNAVFTSLDDEPFEGAVAVKGNKILAVGTMRDIEDYAGADTKIINCGDRLIMPGLNDSHVHLMMGAVQSDEDHCLSVIDCTTREECFARIKAYAEAHPDNSWLFCWGFINAFWTDDSSDPTREELDALVNNRPIVMADAGMHTSCLNTMALEAVGAFEAAAKGDRFVRVREDGTPAGIVSEEFSQTALIAANSMTAEEASEVVSKLIPKLNSVGITSVSDMSRS